MIPGVNIINGKACAASINKARGFEGHSETLGRRYRGQSPLRKFLGSKKHLNLFNIDLNTT